MTQTKQMIESKQEITSAIADLGSKLGVPSHTVRARYLEAAFGESVSKSPELRKSTSSGLDLSGSAHKDSGLEDSITEDDFAKLSLGLQRLPTNLSELVEESNRVSKDQALLQSLSFQTMKARHAEIVLALGGLCIAHLGSASRRIEPWSTVAYTIGVGQSFRSRRGPENSWRVGAKRCRALFPCVANPLSSSHFHLIPSLLLTSSNHHAL